MKRRLLLLALALAVGGAGCSGWPWSKKEKKPPAHSFRRAGPSGSVPTRGPKTTSPPQ